MAQIIHIYKGNTPVIFACIFHPNKHLFSPPPPLIIPYPKRFGKEGPLVIVDHNHGTTNYIPE